MKAFFKKIVERIKLYYDKLIAFFVLLLLLLSLLFLAIKIGSIRSEQRRFDEELANMRKKHPDIPALDVGPFENAIAMTESPGMIESATNPIFVPETRVFCSDCFGPTPPDSLKCVHCGKLREQSRLDDDSDGDGLTDVLEKSVGLNPRDPADAKLDFDDDGFSNADEAKAGSDLRDKNSTPSLEPLIYVSEIAEEPFLVKFKSVIKMPSELIIVPSDSTSGAIKPPKDSILRLKGFSRLVLPDETELPCPMNSAIRFLGNLAIEIKVSGAEDDEPKKIVLMREHSILLESSSILRIPRSVKVLLSSGEEKDFPPNGVIDILENCTLDLGEESLQMEERARIRHVGKLVFKIFTNASENVEIGSFDLSKTGPVTFPCSTFLRHPDGTSIIDKMPPDSVLQPPGKGTAEMPEQCVIKVVQDNKFVLNLRNRTYFAVMGDVIQGFKVVKYTEKLESREDGPGTIDNSELVLEKGDKVYTLVKNKDRIEKEYKARLLFDLDKLDLVVENGSEFNIRSEKYSVITIDMGGGFVVIRRLSDGKEFKLIKKETRESEADGRGEIGEEEIEEKVFNL